MIRIISRNWWVYVARGIIAVLFGVAALLWPAITLGVLVLLFGIYVFIEGLLALGSALKHRDEKGWWILLLEGLAGVLIGALAFLMPGVTAQILLVFIALWAFVTGILELVSAFALRKEIKGEWILGLSGILSMLIGVLLFANPVAGLLMVVWLIGIYAILFGLLLVYLGYKMRNTNPFVGSGRMESGMSPG